VIVLQCRLPQEVPLYNAAHLLLLLLRSGAANAGIPLSIIVKEYGWPAYFNTLIGACALALLLLSPMMNLKSFVQRREIYMQRKLKGQ
jgi:hypothetical protein